jgi:hypothetical protein
VKLSTIIGLAMIALGLWLHFKDDVTPGPGPIPPGEFRALFVYESSAPLTKEQLNIWYSTRIAEYLNAKCAKDDGRPGWRKWDKDIDTQHETPTWKAIWAATKPTVTTLPALVIIRGQKGEAVPLPETEEATLTLLKKHGGE